MAPRVFEQSRTPTVVQLALSLALLLLGIWLLLVVFGPRSLSAWGLVGLFGLLAAISVARLVRPIRLVLDGEGFTVGGGLQSKTWGYRWSEVEGFHKFSQAGRREWPVIGFTLAEGARGPDALNAAAGLQSALPKMPGSLETMVQTLNDYRAQALAEARR
jgi:hypothetical protein